MAGQTDAWQLNYLERQEQINLWAREHYRPRLCQVDKILVRHPSEPNPSPCEHCRAQFFCGKPCEVKAMWERGKAVVERGEI